MGTRIYFVFSLIFSTSYSSSDSSGSAKEFLFTLLDTNLTTYPSSVELVLLSNAQSQHVTISINAKTITGQMIQDHVSYKLDNKKTSSKGQSYHVEATADTSAVLYVNDNSCGEATFLIPLENLGREYRAVTYCQVYGYCQIGIASYLDDTDIEVVLPSSVKNAEVFPKEQYQKTGQTIKAKLSKYSSLYIECEDCDLTGTKVNSDKNIAVTSGGRNVIVGFGITTNSIFEQLPPVSKWGMQFAWVCFECGDQGSYVRIVPSQARTTLKILGQKTIFLDSDWKWFNFRLDKDSGVTVIADKPVMVVAFIFNRIVSSSTFLSSMIVIPPIEQYSTSNTKNPPVYSKTYQTLLKDNSDHTADITENDIKFHPSKVYAIYSELGGPVTITKPTGRCIVSTSETITYGYCMSSYNESPATASPLVTTNIDADHDGKEFKIGIPPLMSEKTKIRITLYRQSHLSVVFNTKPASSDCQFIQVTEPSFIVLESNGTADCLGSASTTSKVLPLTLHISTSSDTTSLVSVIGETKMATFLAIPLSGLGLEYIVVTYCNNEKVCLCTITANSAADVTIMLPALTLGNVSFAGKTYRSYHSFTVLLGGSESFLLTSTSDLTGTFVKANDKIAVVCGGETNHGAFLEQIPPVQSLNKEYLLPYGINNAKLKFVSSEANSFIRIKRHDGIIFRYIFYNVGDYMQIPSSKFEKIISTKPVLVVYIVDDTLRDGFMSLGISPEDFVNTHKFSVTAFKNRVIQLRSANTPSVTVTEDGGHIQLKVNSGSPTSHNLSDTANLTILSCAAEGFAAFLFKISDTEDKRSFGTALGRKIKSKAETCTISSHVINDTRDNDCDGLVDEEICVTKTEVYDCMKKPNKYMFDFDIDGRYSEDCGMEVPEPRRCKCKCNVMGDPSVANISAQELATMMEATKKQLTKNKTTLSSFIRKKTSAEDNRPEAIGVGSIGIVMLTMTLVALTLSDVVSFIKYVVSKFKPNRIS